MPQINSTIPICNEQTSFKEYLLNSWSEVSNDSPPEHILISQKVDDEEKHFDDFSRQVTESDSGFSTGSDEEDRLNSGLCSAEDFDLNIILKPGSDSDAKHSFDFLDNIRKKENDDNKLNKKPSDKNSISVCVDHDKQINLTNDVIQEPGFVLQATNSFDFWNKTNTRENDINNQSIKDLAEENLSLIGDDHDNRTSLSDDVGSFLNLLNSNICEKVSDNKKNSVFKSSDAPIQVKQEIVNDSNSDLNFYEFLSEISSEKVDKMVNSVNHQNNLLNRKSSPLSNEGSRASNNSSPIFDNIYSDLIISLSLDKSCNDGSSELNSTTNNDLNSDKLKDSLSLCNNSVLPENDENLSDLLTSICVESNVENKNLCIDTSFNETGLINKESYDTDISEISIASLAKEYLSSGASNNLLSSLQDNLKLSKDKSVNLKNSSETNINHLNENISQESFDMFDLFAAVNKEHENPNTVYFNDTANDLQFKSDSGNVGSQTVCRPNENSVALFAEKYIRNDESSEDETEGDIEIDLTSCLKSNKLPSLPSKCLSPTDNKTIQETNSDLSYLHSSLFKIVGNAEDSLPFTKSKKTNSKQSLFAKALSCKPKKDKSAILKVLSIKKQFCEHLFNPPKQSFTVKPLKPVACPSNDFIYSALGRRIFEQGNFREVK